MEFTDKARLAIEEAQGLADQYSHPQVLPLHLAVALLTPKEGDSLFKQAIERANGDYKKFERSLQKQLVRLAAQDPPPEDVTLSPSLARLIRAAHNLSRDQKDKFIAVDHLILALSGDQRIRQAMDEAQVNRDSLDSAVQQLRGDSKRDSPKSDDKGVEGENLAKLCIDMTQLAREGKIDPVIGREDEIRRVIRILSRRTKNNPCLIGEPGVGKTTIVEGLARRIVNKDVPANLTTVKLLALDVGSLVAGTSHRGEFEERMKGLLDEIAQSQQMIVLFIDEMHLLMGAGAAGSGGMDAANLLKPMLARGQLHCIGATTLAEYRQHIEKDAAFERRFQQVLVQEPSVDETISILRGLKEKYEVHHGVTITDGAIVAAAQLAARYLTARRLPDSAVDLVDEAAAAVHVARESQPEELDNLERKLRQLQMEIHALEREKEEDESSAQRLKDAQAEAANVKEQLRPLRERWDQEKRRTSDIQDAKIKLDQLKVKRDEAERRGDTATASDLIYYAIPDVERRIVELEADKKRVEEEMKDNADEQLLTDAVRAEQINEIVSRMTGIPVSKLKGNERDRLLQMESHLSGIVVGQREAVRSVANAIRLQRSGLADPNKPPSFLFCGPSGTGKTLLTKALAEFLFDDPNAMIRFDMSEYHDKHTVSRLVGSPPGYVGHEEGGQLTERLRRRPFSILLFDEIEKADKGVLTILLQLMDDGRITDGQGRIVDGKNCIIIMTSNLGAEYFNRPEALMGKTDPQTRELVMGAIRQHLLPEFINRINCITIFNRLTKDGVRQIVDIRISEIEKRLVANGKKIKVSCTDEVKDYLAEAGYSPQYGARPLARLIDKEMLDRMAVLILRDAIKDGETARVILQNGKPYCIPNHVNEDETSYSDADSMDLDTEPRVNNDPFKAKRGSRRDSTSQTGFAKGAGFNHPTGFVEDEEMSDDDY